ncbi:hypothetical protein R1sor_026234 [Riccia sorocarpa]|uniref:Uncharacterized protein n=1 Tax=Riccia sorocarpa TaxID=122646 RepID=A0ABD3GEH1_9MARC
MILNTTNDPEPTSDADFEDMMNPEQALIRKRGLLKIGSTAESSAAGNQKSLYVCDVPLPVVGAKTTEPAQEQAAASAKRKRQSPHGTLVESSSSSAGEARGVVRGETQMGNFPMLDFHNSNTAVEGNGVQCNLQNSFAAASKNSVVRRLSAEFSPSKIVTAHPMSEDVHSTGLIQQSVQVSSLESNDEQENDVELSPRTEVEDVQDNQDATGDEEGCEDPTCNEVPSLDPNNQTIPTVSLCDIDADRVSTPEAAVPEASLAIIHPMTHITMGCRQIDEYGVFDPLVTSPTSITLVNLTAKSPRQSITQHIATGTVQEVQKKTPVQKSRPVPIEKGEGSSGARPTKKETKGPLPRKDPKLLSTTKAVQPSSQPPTANKPNARSLSVRREKK